MVGWNEAPTVGSFVLFQFYFTMCDGLKSRNDYRSSQDTGWVDHLRIITDEWCVVWNITPHIMLLITANDAPFKKVSLYDRAQTRHNLEKWQIEINK